MNAASLWTALKGGTVPPFALLHRPETTGGHVVEVLTGEVGSAATLGAVRLGTAAGERTLLLVPHRQVTERGYAAVEDGCPLVTMRITGHTEVPLSALPVTPEGTVAGGGFDLDDEEYGRLVQRIVTDEIGQGAGSNFVLSRTWSAELENYHPAHAVSLFRRLCAAETGAYWTFLVHTGERTLVGASPERHVSLRDGVAVMNPICGTYRYPATGPTLDGVLDFLDDVKERDELYMVLDEELKMMARICPGGARVVGPALKQMTRLAHTEYLIEGHTELDPLRVLHETLLAPTVTGSPLQSACRVIARHEPQGRAYYGGVCALITAQDGGGHDMDSAILIRTADIAADGGLCIRVGATLVRHSKPDAEAAETAVKVGGLLGAMTRAGTSVPAARPVLAADPRVQGALIGRNAGLAPFWLAGGPSGRVSRLNGMRALVVDAEDMFTAMIGQQLSSLGLDVRLRRFDELDAGLAAAGDEHDIVVLGPGPGDPRDLSDARVAFLHTAVEGLLRHRRPFLAVCLSHQVLSGQLGLPVSACHHNNQGRRRQIDLFGTPHTVGLYNTFAAHCPHDKIDPVGVGPVQVARDKATGEVFALRGAHFASLQFHAESVLTRQGPRIFAERIEEVLGL